MDEKPAILVHLKINSSRLKGKNFKLLNGIPLYKHTFDKLLKNKIFFDVYIHASSDKIRAITKKYGFKFLKRPNHLDEPNAQGNELISDCINKINNKIVIQLFVTNPFLEIKTLKIISKKLEKSNFNSITPITEIYNRFWYKGKEINHKYNKLIGTQFMKPVAVEAGIYCFKSKAFKSEKSRICKKNIFYNVNAKESFDIDTKLDFIIAEMMFKNR